MFSYAWSSNEAGTNFSRGVFSMAPSTLASPMPARRSSISSRSFFWIKPGSTGRLAQTSPEDLFQRGEHGNVGQVEIDRGDRNLLVVDRGQVGAGLGHPVLADRADPVIGPAARIEALGQIVGDRALALAGDRDAPYVFGAAAGKLMFIKVCSGQGSRVSRRITSGAKRAAVCQGIGSPSR